MFKKIKNTIRLQFITFIVIFSLQFSFIYFLNPVLCESVSNSGNFLVLPFQQPQPGPQNIIFTIPNLQTLHLFFRDLLLQSGNDLTIYHQLRLQFSDQIFHQIVSAYPGNLNVISGSMTVNPVDLYYLRQSIRWLNFDPHGIEGLSSDSFYAVLPQDLQTIVRR